MRIPANARLNDRQVKAILYAKENGKITNSEYQKINDCSRNTASNDLKNLVERYLKPSGQRAQEHLHVKISTVLHKLHKLLGVLVTKRWVVLSKATAINRLPMCPSKRTTKEPQTSKISVIVTKKSNILNPPTGYRSSDQNMQKLTKSNYCKLFYFQCLQVTTFWK